MIKTYFDQDTEKLGNRISVPRFAAFERVALRKLVQLNAATSLNDLKGPGLQLEALKKKRVGQHSIRINDQWRVCFIWQGGHAYRVEITKHYE